MTTRLSLPALAGVALAAAFLMAGPAQAACVGIASCAGGGNRFAGNGNALGNAGNRLGGGINVNAGKLVGTDGASIISRDGAGLAGRNGAGILNPGNINPGFRPR